MNLSERTLHKFVENVDTNEWEVLSHDGWRDITYSNKTIPYQLYKIYLDNGLYLECADTHILINSELKEVYAKNSLDEYIITSNGIAKVVSIEITDDEENMYDLTVNGDHLYYTNGILSHNTETVSAYLLWYALYHKEQTIVIASNKSENAMEIIRKIQNAYEELPLHIKIGVDPDNWNKHTCQFDNKSRILSFATTPNTGRGYAISLLYCDEFAFLDPVGLDEKFWTSIYPTLTTGGRCVITSTPQGDTNKFSEIWRQAELGIGRFKPFEIAWDAPPDRDEKFKKETIETFGLLKWRQEYECEFISSEHVLISSDAIHENEKQIKGHAHAFTIGDTNQVFYKKIDQDATYLVGVDPATGNGNDYTVIEVVEFPSMQHVMEYRTNSVKHSEIYIYLKKILTFLEHFAKEVYFSVESNGVGQGILALYDADEKPPEKANLISDDAKDKIGMFTTDKNKVPSCLLLKTLFESGSIKFYSPTLLKELKSYKRSKGSYEAKKGATDDCISAMLIILRILQSIAAYDSRAYHKLYNIDLGNSSDAWVKEVYKEEGGEYNKDEQYDENDVPSPIVLG